MFLFIAVTFVTYMIFFVAPNDPAKLAAGKSATSVQVEQVREYLNLDDPVWKQYGLWMRGARLRGLARPVVRQSPGRERDHRRSRARHLLARDRRCGPLVARLDPDRRPLGAQGRDQLLDRGSMIFVLIGISAHPVWIGLILSFVFRSELGLTPIAGYCDMINPLVGAECGGPIDWAYHLILLWCAFALLFSALYVRLIRATVTETMSEDYVRTARAKGVPERTVLGRTFSATSMLPIVTILGLDIAPGARRRDLHRDDLRPARSRPLGDRRLQARSPVIVAAWWCSRRSSSSSST